MADAPPKGAKRKRGRPKKDQPAGAQAPDPTTLGVDDLAEAESAAAQALGSEPGPKDTPPGAAGTGERKPRRKRVSKQMTQQIEDGLAEILQIPAVPAVMLGDQWMADHFTNQGRALANRIAVVSERNPVLRGWCERAIEGESMAVLLVSGIMYAAPPLMHFGIIPGGEVMGVPVLRRRAPEPEPAMPATSEAPPSREEPVAKPYGGSPTEGESPTPEPVSEFQGPEFQGGNGDGPPTWKEEMIGG